jgi:hypothetical protein
MTRMTFGRSAIISIAGALILLVAVVASGVAQPAEDHPVVGRFSITSEAGGAVWAFQPSGALIVSGPGEIMATGTWAPADADREFDAVVDMTVTGQLLEALGQVSPDGRAIALYVTASEATRPQDWTPWPTESRLTGERFGMVTDPSPSPTPAPPDCARPDWVVGIVDWDRCDDTMTEA